MPFEVSTGAGVKVRVGLSCSMLLCVGQCCYVLTPCIINVGLCLTPFLPTAAHVLLIFDTSNQ